MIEISDLEPLVKAGGKLLDQVMPGWFRSFTEKQLSELNAQDEYHDVLGVLYGSFTRGLAALFPDFSGEERYAEAAKYGFDVTEEMYLYYFDGSHPFVDLTCLWAEVIRDRQENGIPDE